ncbi:hypothetical protein L1987_14340 [Smallanthus sonchifolius]|uniref:Uncharacterized protein n=1 Tax=Smallanthus sonchifolius TaxID=185202 RepID=A0ACB9J4Q5_9ASTR|nr:hypothetical protein L1987_14340 [Smallanthus sonchifolius]
MGQDDFLLTGDLSNTFSALTVNGRHQVNTKLVKEEDVLQQIEDQEQEINQLRRHLAEYAAKEAQIQDEKRVIENRIALMHKAFDQEQQDLIEAASKAIAYRQDIVEENIRVGYALQAAQEERSMFVSSLVPLLSDQSIHPAALDAYSIVSSLRILFKHNKERLAIAEDKLRDSQYQPLVLHSNRKDVESQTSGEDVVNSHYLPSILEEEHEQEFSSSLPEVDYSEEDDDVDDNNNNSNSNGNKPLPTIEGLQILGEPYPGNEIQASGYSRNGTTHCGFEWVRHLQDGSFVYIEGAKQPMYTVTADDVDNYLSVEVQPLDGRQRKGEVVRCFANDNKKITCHPDMLHEIVNALTLGHASFKLFVWKGSVDSWEPAILKIKKSGYSIKVNGANNGVVVDNKYTPKTVISLPAEAPLEFAILGPDDVEQYLCVDYNSNDIRYSRDTIVLIMRLFVQRAVDKKLGKKKKKKKKRRVLFFK